MIIWDCGYQGTPVTEQGKSTGQRQFQSSVSVAVSTVSRIRKRRNWEMQVIERGTFGKILFYWNHLYFCINVILVFSVSIKNCSRLGKMEN